MNSVGAAEPLRLRLCLCLHALLGSGRPACGNGTSAPAAGMQMIARTGAADVLVAAMRESNECGIMFTRKALHSYMKELGQAQAGLQQLEAIVQVPTGQGSCSPGPVLLALGGVDCMPG
jgi:hypothetical protein